MPLRCGEARAAGVGLQGKVRLGPTEFVDEAKDSPLAQQLFYLPFVKTVYIASNFVALERFDIVEWDDVKDEVAQQLVEYLNAGEPIVNEVDVKKKQPITEVFK
mgnify:CR=1 FL=1